MDVSAKMNIENIGVENLIRNKGSNAVNSLKGLVKPLHDVKNIFEEKANLLLSNNEKKLKSSECKKANLETEFANIKIVDSMDGDDSPLFFENNIEERYIDIIPASLQLTRDDINRLVSCDGFCRYENELEIIPDFLPEDQFLDMHWTTSITLDEDDFPRPKFVPELDSD